MPMPSSIRSDERPNLYPGEALFSSSERVSFQAQIDGNVVIYAHLGGVRFFPLWSTNTAGHKFDRLCMNTNGELAAFTNPGDGATTTWKSGSWNSGRPGPYTLIIQDDGNLCIYGSDGSFVWQSGSHVSEVIEFAEVIFEDHGTKGMAGNAKGVFWPLVKDKEGGDVLWNPREDKPNSTYDSTLKPQGVKVRFSGESGIGDRYIGDGNLCSLGMNMMWANDVLVDPVKKVQFRYKRDSRQGVKILARYGEGVFNGTYTF